jgi:hypothetical protein
MEPMFLLSVRKCDDFIEIVEELSKKNAEQAAGNGGNEE